MCPHSANEYHGKCEMSLVNLKCHDGITRFYYTANSSEDGGHLCSYQGSHMFMIFIIASLNLFTVYVPSVGGATGVKVIHSEEELLDIEQQEIEGVLCFSFMHNFTHRKL